MARATQPDFQRPSTIRIVLLALAGIVILSLAAEPLALIPLHIQRNYNEGWGALFTDIALSDGDLYPPPGAFIANNYPPLSFYIVGALGSIIGDHVVALRLIALAAYLAVAAGVLRAVLCISGSRQWAVVSGTVFMLYGVTVFQGYFAMADPQWLAHAVATAGLVLLLRAPGALPARDIATACLLILVSGLIKHNLMALPIAVTLWLAWQDRRGLAVWLATGVASAAITVAALYGLYGSDVFTSVMGHSRALRLANIVYVPWELGALLPLGIGALLLLRRWRDGRARLILIFAVVAGIWGLFQRMGEGVTYNAQFEMFIALTIAAGAGMATLSKRRRWLTAVIAAVLFLPLAFQGGKMLAEVPGRLARLPEKQENWEALIAAVAARPGPAACERLAVCYWAGKGFEFDFFNYGQRLYTGASSPSDFEALMRSRRLDQILVANEMFGADSTPELPQPSVDVMLRYYRQTPTAVADFSIMLPKP